MKIILFYSSIGQGHISAACSIEKEILRKNSDVVILKKDIREFMDPIGRMLDEKMYWFVAKHLPILFDSLFQSMQEKGNAVGSLTCLSTDYPEQKVYEYIEKEAPDAILSTHYGAAQVLGNLRERGLLLNIKLGWLHTDYFEGYFPRISKRIDRTFLAHPALEESWLAAGVFSDLIETSGMPVNIPANKCDASPECLLALGFSPSIRTITIASGKEGVGDFPGIVKSIARETDEAVQIIAVCGHNTKQIRALTQIQAALSPLVNLEILGFISQPELVSFIQVSDLFITKAGGLSPTEAFVLGKPTILLTVISGHEKKNAALFSELGMAELNTDIAQIGMQVNKLLADQEKQIAMLAAQREFRENINIEKIVRFLLAPQASARHIPEDFGLEHGHSAANVHNALLQLDLDAPADMEILLSYSSSREDERIVRENPFGHIALRVGNTVYSTNYIANPGKDTLLQHITLAEYLFGILPPSDHQEHTSTYGMAYGRDTLGFRINGVSTKALNKMQAEADRIEAEFHLGLCTYDAKKSNCADFVVRILQASGYEIEFPKVFEAIYTMPLDIFEAVCKRFEGDPEFMTEIVAYRRLAGSQSTYRFSRFPLSLVQLGRGLAQVLRLSSHDRLESMVSKQLMGYIGDDRIFYEKLNVYSQKTLFDDCKQMQSRIAELEQILLEEVLRFLKEQTLLGAYKINLTAEPLEKISGLINQCYDAARLSTEQAERVLHDVSAKNMREAFVKLTNEYAALCQLKPDSEALFAFLNKLSEFNQIVNRRLNDLEAKQHELLSGLLDVPEKMEDKFKRLLGTVPQWRQILNFTKHESGDRKF